MSKKVIAILIIAFVFIGAIGLPHLVPRFETVISGYDGLEATMQDVTHGYTTAEESITPTTAQVDPFPASAVGALTDVTGVRAEIGQPEVIGQRQDYEKSINVLDEEEGTNTTKTWEARIVELEMGIVLRTCGAGWVAIEDVTFWIELKETTTSVFSNADESLAYIISVETIEPATLEGDIDVSPASGGKEVEMTTIKTEEPPQWLIDSGYSGNLRYFTDVKFPIKVISATPAIAAGFIGEWLNLRTEAQATIRLEVEVLLFGYWEVVKEYNPIEPPPYPDWLGDLIAWLEQSLIVVAGFAGMVIIIYVAPKRWKLLGPVVFVLALAYSLGWLDPLLGALGV